MTSVRPEMLQGLRWGEAVAFSSMSARGLLSAPFLYGLDRFGEEPNLTPEMTGVSSTLTDGRRHQHHRFARRSPYPEPRRQGDPADNGKRPGSWPACLPRPCRRSPAR